MSSIFQKKKLLFNILFTFLFFNSILSQYTPLDKSKEEKIKKYVEDFRQGKLYPNRVFKKSENPKISIIIPMYNEEKNVLSIIRSIQNQNLQDIEIVCVNDNSKDKTLSILKQLKEEDPRITIITNKSNRGVIYNRIYGALESKGEYVTFVDADDGLCNPEILEKAYDVATFKYNQKIDVVHYQTCGCQVDENGQMGNFVLFSTFNPYNFGQVLKQPEIGDNYFQKGKNITESGLVFDKIYKKQLIKKVASYIGPHIWNQNLVFSDDFLLAYGIMRMAKSMVNIEDIGYWHLLDTETSTTSNVWEIEGYRLKNPEKSNKKIGDYMLITERLLELTENEPGSIEFREFALRKLGEKKFMKAIARSVYYDKYLYLCDKFINWKYIDQETKKRTLDFVKYLLKFKINVENMFEYIVDADDNDDDDDDDDEDYLINNAQGEL
jgi:glycosyltransferase involved in cell wall biosynthesis